MRSLVKPVLLHHCEISSKHFWRYNNHSVEDNFGGYMVCQFVFIWREKRNAITRSSIEPIEMTSKEPLIAAFNKFDHSDESSPARKRSRINPPVCENLQNWRTTNNVGLDPLSDGVGYLPDDSPDQAVKDNYPDFLIPLMTSLQANAERDKQIAMVLQSTISKETLEKISGTDWEKYLICKPKREVVFKINHFQHLSDEVILQIFRWLPKCTLKNAALVCKKWFRLSQDETLWSRMDISGSHLEAGALGHVLSRQPIILRLSNSEISDLPILPGVRAAMPDFQARLVYLDLSMAYISPTSLCTIFNKCCRLKKLSLENVYVNNSVLIGLSKSTNLEILNLAMTEGLEKQGLSYLFTNCLKLKELNLAWTYLSSSCIEYICSHLPRTIDRLNFAGCRKLLTDVNVLNLVSSCPNLRELDLSDCTVISGHSIECIVRLKQLNFLALSRCYFISYRSLLQLKSINSLMYFDVHGGHISSTELDIVQKSLGPNVHVNKFKFSSVARPTVGPHRSSIWGLRVKD
ncbi:hypothetical protein FQA39_LY02612 [Lamprigera yunnana]|nr:hypothetical protein FQA39_LY02612 [Lamprigera yunnana]